MRKRFSPYNRISIKFADNEGNSEGAVDVGGPKREFLRLVVKAANEASSSDRQDVAVYFQIL